MSAKSSISVRNSALVVIALALLIGVVGYQAGRLRAAPSVTVPIVHTVLEPVCPNSITATATFAKIRDLGTFDVQAADSLVEITFHGRLYASSTDGTGIRYELRVDDAASPAGRIRAVLKQGEMGGGIGRNASMGGLFTGLSQGTHTVSLWAQVANGTTASTVMYDPGCWSSDQVVIKEYLPFGSVALPAVLKSEG